MNPEAQLPAALAAALVGVSRQLFNYWRAKDKIEPVATDRKGRAFYRLGDVIDLEKTMRKQSRRPVRIPAP